MKFIALREARVHSWRTRTSCKTTNSTAALLMTMINKPLEVVVTQSRHSCFYSNTTSLFYCCGETTDQSRLSVAWQTGKSEKVIEEVSRPRGAVSVARLSDWRHWWTVKVERELLPGHYEQLKRSFSPENRAVRPLVVYRVKRLGSVERLWAVIILHAWEKTLCSLI